MITDDILDAPLSEDELEGLRVLNGLNMDVHLLAIRAVREIRKLRSQLAEARESGRNLAARSTPLHIPGTEPPRKRRRGRKR